MARKAARTGNVRAPFTSSSSSAPAKTRVPARKLNTSNAYTYIPALPKRARQSEQTLSLTRDESGPAPRRRPKQDGEDEDEDEAMEARIKKLAMMIADDEVGMIGDSDEESIDSDEAWGEDGSDEERWGDVFRDLEKGKKQSSKGKAKAKDVVLKVW
jgi:U3 small nucleolar RNA-associated protein 14